MPFLHGNDHWQPQTKQRRWELPILNVSNFNSFTFEPINLPPKKKTLMTTTAYSFIGLWYSPLTRLLHFIQCHLKAIIIIIMGLIATRTNCCTFRGYHYTITVGLGIRHFIAWRQSKSMESRTIFVCFARVLSFYFLWSNCDIDCKVRMIVK